MIVTVFWIYKENLNWPKNLTKSVLRRLTFKLQSTLIVFDMLQPFSIRIKKRKLITLIFISTVTLLLPLTALVNRNADLYPYANFELGFKSIPYKSRNCQVYFEEIDGVVFALPLNLEQFSKKFNLSFHRNQTYRLILSFCSAIFLNNFSRQRRLRGELFY